jgi:hypothetical protein
MMTNQRIANVFRRLADLMELREDNPYQLVQSLRRDQDEDS